MGVRAARANVVTRNPVMSSRSNILLNRRHSGDLKQKLSLF